jgi:hypothetical protein
VIVFVFTTPTDVGEVMYTVVTRVGLAGSTGVVVVVGGVVVEVVVVVSVEDELDVEVSVVSIGDE